MKNYSDSPVFATLTVEGPISDVRAILNRIQYDNAAGMQDIVTMLCPRPVCVCHGAQDPIYPVDSVQQVIDRAEQVYRDAGCTDHFQSAIFPNAGHVFEEEQQKYAIDFLNKWL